jgi:hypothetical protein
MLSLLVKWIQLRVVAPVGHTALGCIAEHLNKAMLRDHGTVPRFAVATH